MTAKKKYLIKKPEHVLWREDAIVYTKDGVLTIPETITSLSGDFAFFVVRSDLPRVHTLNIPKSVSYIVSMRGDYSHGPYGYRNNPFEQIVVSSENEYFTSLDGVLFTKDMSTLLCYPCGKKNTVYQVPDGVRTIAREAFLNVEHLRTIQLPQSLETIETHAFSACIDLDFPDVITIYPFGKKYLFSLPAMMNEIYDPEARIYYCVSQNYIKKISEHDFDWFMLQEEAAIEDDQTRRKLLSMLCSLIDRISWGFEYDIEKQELCRFRDVFFSEHV